MKIGTYETHPAADRFPMLDGERLAELAADIRARGQLQPIVLCDGKVLDGRNRLAACVEHRIPPRIEDYEGDNPFRYVWSTNGQRRDLEKLQRAAIWVLLNEDAIRFEAERRRADANARRSEKARSQPRSDDGRRLADRQVPHQVDGRPDSKNPTAEAIASEIGDVGSATVQRAQAIAAFSPELAEKVARGEVKGQQALREIRRSKLSGKVAALPEGQYRVIYADPPWKYGDERIGVDGFEDTAAADHYPTMSVAELSALDVRQLAAPDAVLFCWATFPLLPDALEVVRAWGFRYKTAFVWDKQRSNVGSYHDARAELLLVATRGSCVAEIVARAPQVVSLARGAHSAKPEHFRRLVESLYPSAFPGHAVELFRRGPTPEGWIAWGNEVAA